MENLKRLQRQVEGLETNLADVKSTADSAKARVIILQEAVYIFQKQIKLPPKVAAKLDDVMSQLQ
jgi:hypothetical protein